MCYNAEISLNTFIYGLVSAIIVLLLNQTSLDLIIIVLLFTSIQLLEYFTWKYINNKKINYYLSIIGFFIIIIQILYLNYKNLEGYDRLINLIIILLLSLYILNYVNRNNLLYMDKGINGHLRWHWIDIEFPLLLCILFYYLYTSYRKGKYINLLFTFITLIISFYYYYKYKTWGSMWCYISNIIWIFLILRSIYLSQNNFRFP